MEEKWTDSPQDIAALLDRWRGLWAKPVAYTDNCRTLILQLYHPQTDSSLDRSECAYVKCEMCSSVLLLQTHWTKAGIAISSTPHPFGQFYTLIDSGHLHIVCERVSVTESEIEKNFQAIFAYPD